MRIIYRLSKNFVEYRRLIKLIGLVNVNTGEVLLIFLCYLLITFFDFLGLGAVFFFAQQALGGKAGTIEIGYIGFDPTSTELLVVIPLAWLAKFVVILFANKTVILFSQNICAQLRVRAIVEALQDPAPHRIINVRTKWSDTVARQLGIASSGIIEPGLRGMFDSVLLIFLGLYLIYLSPMLFLTYGLWIILGLSIFDRLVRGRLKHVGSSHTELSENLAGEVTGLSAGFGHFWALKSKDFFANRMRKKAAKLAFLHSEYSVMQMSPRLLTELLIVVGVCGSIFVSIQDTENFSSILSAVAVMAVASVRMIPLINSVSLGINQIRVGHKTIQNVLNFFGQKDACEANQDKFETAKPTPIESLSVNALEYLVKDQKIISNFDLDLSIGENCLITGPSGVGKTTIIECLAGIRKQFSGEVTFRGVGGQTFHANDPAIRIGYAPQEPVILEGTVLENLLLENPPSTSVDQRRFSFALKVSQFDDILSSLSAGLDTKLLGSGVSLSGGQKQKLCLCRAILHSDGLLLLDEPTSAFDAAAEEMFFRTLRLLKRSYAVVLVSHSSAADPALFDKHIKL